ncbi:nitroreductase family protein [Kaistia defluvii]|uniref:Nitroreductase n=1 Tax=Kaistia defluvii TaxID=410841 RepID=A0ABV2QUD7_9HYPH
MAQAHNDLIALPNAPLWGASPRFSVRWLSNPGHSGGEIRRARMECKAAGPPGSLANPSCRAHFSDVTATEDESLPPMNDQGPAHHAAPATAAVPIYDDSFELQFSPNMLAKLETRRSVPMRAFDPMPIPPEHLERILKIAARSPDHGRLAPWRFIVIEGEARQLSGQRFDALYAARNPGLDDSKRDMWTLYMMRAPVTVVVVSRPDPTSRIPEWDQILGSGAVGMNLILAASAHGYATQWLLKWPGRDPEAAAILGVQAGERVAGFIHLGRQTERPADRARPDLNAIVTHWAG